MNEQPTTHECFSCNEQGRPGVPAVAYHQAGDRMGVLGACAPCRDSYVAYCVAECLEPAPVYVATFEEASRL